jgi:hypothetical protein
MGWVRVHPKTSIRPPEFDLYFGGLWRLSRIGKWQGQSIVPDSLFAIAVAACVACAWGDTSKRTNFFMKAADVAQTMLLELETLDEDSSDFD